VQHVMALNEDSAGFDRYAEMLQTAVVSARANTSLRTYVIYDGQPNWLTEWLEGAGVTVVPCRSRFLAELQEMSQRTGRISAWRVGSGAMLRIELPELFTRLEIADPYILYTDVDVLFLQDPVPVLEGMRPRHFAVAPEREPENYVTMNTGVMLMNTARLARDTDRFVAFVRANLEDMSKAGWDQGAYRAYYGPHRPHQLRPARWDRLQPELNWKPYWGHDEGAVIVHFHGPKPNDRSLLALPQDEQPNRLWAIQDFVNDGYHAYCDIWDGFRSRV